MQREDIAQLSIGDLNQVTGGVHRIGRAFEQQMVHSMKNMAERRNQFDGQLVNHLRPSLLDSIASKARGWLHGQSINSLTTEMRHNPSSLPAI